MNLPITPSELKQAEVVNEVTGQKWVYSEIVKDHFFHPRNLLLEDPAPGAFDAEGVVGSPACLAPNTLIRNNERLMPIETLTKGNPVVAHDDEVYPIERVYRLRYEGVLRLIRTQLGDLIATPDHLIHSIILPKIHRFRYVKNKKQMLQMWNHASELAPRDICVYPISQTVVPVETMLTQQERKTWDFKSRSIPGWVSVEPDLLELFGYFIAEGSSRRAELAFTFGSHEEHLGLRVRKLVKRYFGLEVTMAVRGTRLDVHVYNTHLSQWFAKQFGKGAVNKRFPDWMLWLDPGLQKGLIKGMWLGDGYVNLDRRNQRAGYATISQLLAHQIKFLLLRQHIIPSWYREAEKTVRGVHHQASYRIHVGDIDSLKRLCTILGITWKPAETVRTARWAWIQDGLVFVPVKKVMQISNPWPRLCNLEVATAHTYLTDAFAVHNCGDVMNVWLKITDDRITDLKWRTFGCGSAIAATSMFSVMVTENGGAKIDDALKIRPQDIMARLGGLPNRKIHCSVLADKAFRKAVNGYFRATGQHERIVVEGAKVIDARLNITDKDIEEAVLEGAQTLEEVQNKLKVGVGDPEAIPAIEELIRFYKEKYYG